MEEPTTWLLFIHNIPPKPGYLRAKAARKLASFGAVALKNAVYALPDGESRQEDLAWLAKEIEDGGGRAFVCRSSFVAGLDDARARALFIAASDAGYARLAEAIRAAPEGLGDASGAEAAQALARFDKEFEAIRALDFFGAPGRETVDGLLAAFRAREREGGAMDEGSQGGPQNLRGRVWVLIRRFIDPEASFRFVEAKSYTPAPAEVRFDMLTGEFTHEGDLCTFEVLARRIGADDPALRKLAEMVHDIDLKEDRYGHPESAGLRAALEALALTVAEDERRLEQGAVMLDLMYESFRTRQPR